MTMNDLDAPTTLKGRVFLAPIDKRAMTRGTFRNILQVKMKKLKKLFLKHRINFPSSFRKFS